ncbi:MAG: hypothetical protein D3908_14405 [Candidatus Electrothrix sp. AUS4]|nr:hypothetical protein [Candidatus Electrothrix sp. AUS4]
MTVSFYGTNGFCVIFGRMLQEIARFNVKGDLKGVRCSGGRCDECLFSRNEKTGRKQAFFRFHETTFWYCIR